jgi:kynurenine 3-monooxygenase
MDKKIIVIGAGLCGTLLALRLAQRGHKVTIYERRQDMRTAQISAGRSINLALSNRGLKGLRLVGLEDQVNDLVIPMEGRMIHPMQGDKSYVRYSGRTGEWINSVSRGGLNILLLNEAEKTGLIDIHFNMECQDIDFDGGKITLTDMSTKTAVVDSADVIFGTDGANSAVRNGMMAQSPRLRFDFSQKYLDTGYKELEIPPAEDGSFRLEHHALHIWPRAGYMMIALPNLDGSFTVTLFMPFEGEKSFSNLQKDDEILSFFEEQFPTAYAQMPDLLADYRSNPSSSLGTIKCYPWQVNGKFLLMGDAAHAVVPFYGQGMNASFEDVVVLDGLIDEYGDNWPEILRRYQEVRKVDTDAIADLAQDNFYEMRDGTADPVFLLKRKLELHLEQTNPNYFSKYSMVTFREDLPYHIAMTKGRQQDQILMDFASKVTDVNQVNYDELAKMLV